MDSPFIKPKFLLERATTGDIPMAVQTRDIMVSKVVTIKKDSTVKEAVRLMNEHEIGCLVVTENKKAIGILTERDLLKRVLAKSQDISETKVEEVMSTPLISVQPDVEIGDVSRIMFQKNIKKMPIIRNEKLLGLVTLTDILRIQPQLIRMYKIFSADLAPKRIRKVFDYYLLVESKLDVQLHPEVYPSVKKAKAVKAV
ncbi:MAG TPA: CBS domain-containing protein [Candidatus Paceibacterota bacterium]|nr:CBS domain-containing protein [Candidatus Paceibacterota bacterium]